MTLRHPRRGACAPARTIRFVTLTGIAMSTASAALGVASGLEDAIMSTSPSHYWTLEDTSLSTVPRASSAPIALRLWELHGANTQDPMEGSVTPEYLPMLPAHRTSVDGSTASVFGELGGVLAGARRHAFLTDSDLGDDPLDALGMTGASSWTLHVLASLDPREGDPLCLYGQPVFTIGDPSDGVSLVVEPFKTDPPSTDVYSTYTVTRVVGGTPVSTSVNVDHLAAPTNREWHEIFVTYDVPPVWDSNPIPTLTLRVNGVSSSVADSAVIPADSDGAMVLGADDEDTPSCVFYGAMHHLAFWDDELSGSDVSKIEASLSDPAPTRDVVFTDWDAPLRYYMWTRPIRGTAVPVGERDILRWQDAFWDHKEVYPMVRFHSQLLTTTSSNSTAPDFTGSGSVADYGPQGDNEPADLAQATWNWLYYMEMRFNQYATQGTGGAAKSLADAPGYSIFWQNWGREENDEETDEDPNDWYADWSGGRGLLHNWRDAQPDWRLDDPGANRLINDRSEVANPFYREGASQNAFRTHETMHFLAELLADRPITHSGSALPAPGRLHLDIEGNATVDTSLPSSVAHDWGWWSQGIADDRADDPEHWSSPSNLLTSLPTPGDLDEQEFESVNNAFQSALNTYTSHEYETAINHALLNPARELLDSDILASEYNMYLSNTRTLDHLDFSSPVLYPIGPYNVRDYDDEDNITLVGWYDFLDFDDRGIALESGTTPGSAYLADETELNEDFDNIFVEYSKYKVIRSYRAGIDVGEENTRPIAPWIPYPGWSRPMTYYKNSAYHDVFDDYDAYTTKWQEIARVAAFAYRHGVREFIGWGGDSLLGATHSDGVYDYTKSTANVIDMEKVICAVRYAQNSVADVTTSGATDRVLDPEFGVPDGAVDSDDWAYYLDRYSAGDMEADVTGLDGRPDGVVDLDDLNAFLTAYNNPPSTCPECDTCSWTAPGP